MHGNTVHSSAPNTSELRRAALTLRYIPVSTRVTNQARSTSYLWMAAGVAITGVVAWGISTRPEIMQMIWGGPVGMILSIGTFIGAIALQRMVPKMSRGAASELMVLSVLPLWLELLPKSSQCN